MLSPIIFHFPSDLAYWQPGSFVLSLAMAPAKAHRLINQWEQGQQYHPFLPLPPETRRSKVSLATLERMHFILAASTWHDHIAAEGGKKQVLK